MPDRRLPSAPLGFTLIETMVGIVIAFVAIIIIFQMATVSEGFKRNTTSINDAQQNGLISSFMLGIQLANAGNALANASNELGTCENPLVKNPTWSVTKAFANSWRPVPVMIVDGGADDKPDSFAVSYSMSSTIIAPALFTASAAANSTYAIQSPGGFHVDDLILAITLNGTCNPSRITALTTPDGNGVVTITHTGNPAAMTASSVLFNLGPSGDPQKSLYDVQSGVLRSSTLIDKAGAEVDPPIANPIASNVVNMKLQYGIDTDNDGLVDSWVGATGVWAPDQLLAGDAIKINQIKAVRIGVIVQGEQFDKTLGDFSWGLFKDANGKNPVYSGTFKASTSPPGNFRYRTYETVIPLRNELWNRQT
jgi:type IV pilus assembly protein PilW